MPTEVQGLLGGETIHVLGLQWQVLWVPGHTQGHIAYFADAGHQAPILFCGDTLFSAGCGRLFEGTAEQMHASLQTLSALPAATLLCCAHEYTLNNLRFAMQVEPDNPMLGNYYAHCNSLRANGLPTLPSTIGQERNINPFLRSEQASIINSAQHFNPAGFAKNGCFATLRHWKNEYQ
jgi:hydroxyacylglutathione hydrolase